MSIYKKTGKIGIRCLEALKLNLERLAANENRSISDYIHLILEEEVKNRCGHPNADKIGGKWFCGFCDAELDENMETVKQKRK